MRVAGALAISLLVAAGSAARAQQADTISIGESSPFWPAAAGGVVGSGAGVATGVLMGAWSADCDRRGPDGGADFCGVGEALVGFAVGSIIGSAAGAYVGSRLGGDKPSALSSALGAVAGAFVGVALGVAVDRVVEADASGFIAYIVGQGAIAGLATALWR